MAEPDGATPDRGGAIRVHRPQAAQWTSLPNALLRDARLSFRARGALAWMLSHDDGFLVSTAQLHDHANEGREAIRTVLRELRDAGYLEQSRERDEAGRWRTVTVVTGDGFLGSGDGFPGPGFPGAGFPGCKKNDQENDYKNDDYVVDAREADGTEPSPTPPPGRVLLAAPATDVPALVAIVERAVGTLTSSQRGVVTNAVMEDRAGVAALLDHAVAYATRPAAYVVSACRTGQHVGFSTATPAVSAREQRRRDANERVARFMAKAAR